MNYRKEIDGLRAIAILPVIWIHSGLPFLSGGFLGVDVFFVISGFLITSILVKELDAGSFKLSEFYERRARRILPALVAVIGVTTVVVLIIAKNPKFLEDYGQSVMSTVFFSSNIYFWQTSGYFGSASELAPMLHTWSLAVEEQFYIFFPLLLMLLFPYGRKVVILAIILIGIISLSIAEWAAIHSPFGNFYLLPSRAWELMAGSLAAIFYSSSIVKYSREIFSGCFSFIGLALILSSYIFYSPSTAHPSSLTILPVLGAVLVLLFAEDKNIIGKLLSTKILSFVGLISYSLYLWHQPVLALMKSRYSLHLEINNIIFSIILIFVLSYLSWKFVETPFRSKQKYPPKKIMNYSLASIAIGAFGSLILVYNLSVQRIIFPENMFRYEILLEAQDAHSEQIMFENDDCKFWSEEFSHVFINRFNECKAKYRKAVFILGGSHAKDLYNAVAISSKNPFIVSVSRGFCRPHKYLGNERNLPKCQYQDFEKFAKEYSSSISHVIYTQTPESLFTINSLHEASIENLALKQVDEVTDYLRNLKQEYKLDVTMIGMFPPLKVSPINWNFEETFESQFDEVLSDNSIQLTKMIDGVLISKLAPYDISYITKFDGFNLKFPNDLVFQNKITYSDDNHISLVGEKLFGQRLVNYLRKLGYEEL